MTLNGPAANAERAARLSGPAPTSGAANPGVAASGPSDGDQTVGVPLTITDGAGLWRRIDLPPAPWCNGCATFGWYLDRPGDAVPPAAAASDVGDRVRDRVQALVHEVFAAVAWPQVTIGINPRGIGLVGLPSLYWVEGYDGRPFGARRAADVGPEAGLDVPLSEVAAGDPRRRAHHLEAEVRVAPPRVYRWSFGDGGTALSGSLGVAYTPGGARSDIQHQYEFSSFYHPGGFPVSMEAEFSVGYSVTVDGATQTFDLGPMAVRYSRAYPVQEIQAVLLAPDATLPPPR
jgi:hypothetical protein